jgi:hypothetical protein
LLDSSAFQFTVTDSGPVEVGEIRWAAEHGVPSTKLNEQVTLQHGQELLYDLTNPNAFTLLNGQVIYVDGTVASASNMQANQALAVMTQDLPVGEKGFATTAGLVHDLDTSALIHNGPVYLGENGGLTATEPSYPSTSVQIGYCVKQGVADGILYVRIESNKFKKALDVSQAPIGVYDRTQTTLSYNPTTRTATITPLGAYWSYFRKAVEYRKTTTVSLTHTATTGSWFFYIDNTGTFVLSQTPWSLLDCCPLMYIYYNASSPSSSIALEERHGATRNPEWHRGQHNTVGTYYQSGLAVSGYTLTGTTNAENTFAIASGVISDEDIQATLTALADGGPYPIRYRSGTNGDWVATTASVPYTSGTYAQYNQYTGSTWQLTDITNGDYFNIYVVGIPSISGYPQIVVVPGQAKYASSALAEAAKLADDVSWGTEPLSEFSVLHRFTLRAGSGYTTTGKVRLEAYKDLRGKSTRIAVISGVV